MTKLGETLYNLHWLACDAEGYVGDRAAAEALLAEMPKAPAAITGAALNALMEVFGEHVYEEVYDVGGTDLCLWETPLLGGPHGSGFYLIWYAPDIANETYVLTDDEADALIERAQTIIVATPGDEED